MVASACFLLGLGVCLFYALRLYNITVNRDNTAVVVIRAWFVRMNMAIRAQVCIMVEFSEMKLVVKNWKSKNKQKSKEKN